MKKHPKYRSKVSAAIHEMATDLHEIGVIDKETMARFDKSCLTPVHPFTPKDIRTLRQREGVSQPVLAYYLGVSKVTVSKWERGEKKPSGASMKLLSLVETKGLSAIA